MQSELADNRIRQGPTISIEPEANRGLAAATPARLTDADHAELGESPGQGLERCREHKYVVCSSEAPQVCVIVK